MSSLDGFGIYPVELCIDPNSYPGPASHTARFRNRSGWLTLAELQIENAGVLHSYTLLAACDEYGEAIPSFLASNLLDCGCSYPSPCDEIPPDELDFVLDQQVDLAKRRWVRETNAELLALHEDAADELEILEGLVKRHVDDCDRQIADLRRRRRLEVLDAEKRASLSQTIAELEADQDTAISNLDRRRKALRANVRGHENDLLQRRIYKSSVEAIYVVKWVAPVNVDEEISAILQDLQQTGRMVHNERLIVSIRDQLPVIGQGFVSTYRDKYIPQKPNRPLVSDVPSSSLRFSSSAPRDIGYHVTGTWSLARLKVLEEMWVAGRTPIEIAEALGNVSRNAVVGKAYRIGLLARHPMPKLEIGVPAQPQDAMAQTSPLPALRSPSSNSDSNFAATTGTSFVQAPDHHAEAIEPVRNLPTQPEEVSVTPLSKSEDFTTQRAKLIATFEALEIEGRKFLPGSPNTSSNALARADIEQKLHELDRRAGMVGKELMEERAAFVEMLNELKIEGRKFFIGSQKFLRNELKQTQIEEKISSIDRQTASSEDQQQPLNPKSDDASSWTDARIAYLKNMWSAGLTASEIAKNLGNASRNAVISKAKRLGLRISPSDPVE